jgi:deoxycytidylate deaminase
MAVLHKVSVSQNSVKSQLADMEDGLCRFLRIAKKESLKSHAPYKLGCVIVQKRKIIGRGYNLYRTDPRMGVGYHQYYHAETKALKEALSKGYDVEGATAYIYREGGLLAKPCVNCQRVLRSFGITEFVYTQGIKYESTGHSQEAQ